MSKQNKKLDWISKINLAIAIIAVFSVGGLTGYLLGYFRLQETIFPAIIPVPDVNEGVAMVQLLEVKNGQLMGRVGQKPVRIIHHPDGIVELSHGGVFSIPVSEINLGHFFIQNSVPEGTLYMASQKGDYYYSVYDPQAYQIKAENRLYFKNSDEAEQAGFKARE